MRLTSLGGAGSVTGSSHLIQHGDRFLMLDCGLFQGSAARNRNAARWPLPGDDIDAVIVSHAHVDHCGRLPHLRHSGFAGRVYMTPATAELCDIMLRDSARINAEDQKRINRKRKRAGQNPLPPLFNEQDVDDVLDLVEPVDYETEFEPVTGLRAAFLDAGHLLGSAQVQIQYSVGDRHRTLIYSGDLGTWDAPILRHPTGVPGADVVLMESTYGDRDHGSRDNNRELLTGLISYVAERGGNLIIPAFAVGRTQELLYMLDSLYRDDEPPVTVVVDSPMAIRATDVFRRHHECYDRRAVEQLETGDDPLVFPGLKFSRTPRESMQLNHERGNLIIAGSGMADGGRVRHHLKHNLWRKESAVLFAGFQARGTLGRKILDQPETVHILGDRIELRARIEQLTGLSAHAGRSDLNRWVEGIDRPKPSRVILVHGEDEARRVLAEDLKQKGLTVESARPGETVNLDG